MMEIEYFIPPDEGAWQLHLSQWIEDSWQWLVRLGLREELLSRKEHKRNADGSGLAHYARACTDIEFHFPFGRSVRSCVFRACVGFVHFEHV
jgi:glycyl-tRNA synthetase